MKNAGKNKNLWFPRKLCGIHFCLNGYKVKNLHSHRIQLASLASLSAPSARDSIDALRAQSYTLHMYISLFLVI